MNMQYKTCAYCGKDVLKPEKEIKRREKQEGLTINWYCDAKCRDKSQLEPGITKSCKNCQKVFVSRVAENRKFCCKSCATSYNNKHKKFGTRRSKLEEFLELEIHSNFPNLEMLCNCKTVIGSELDFYFPQLKLAIELNGPLHYEPIYGRNKLENIQNNDKQKMIQCFKRGIELCVVDVSRYTYFPQRIKEQFKALIFDLITPLLERIGPHTLS